MSRTIDADALINELNNSHYPGAPYIDAGISIAIGKVCDAPTIEPERKTGRWISQDHNKSNGMVSTLVFYYPKCSECGHSGNYDMNFCPNCGADMRNAGEIARDIMHEAIDNSAWSDTVNVEEMHRVVDDKYAEG